MTQQEKDQYLDKYAKKVEEASKIMVRNWILAHGLTHTLTAEKIYECLQFTIDTIKEHKIVEAEIKRFNEVCERVAKEEKE